MDFDRYRALVLRFEAEARAHPRRYERRVAWLGLLGYAYLLGLGALALGLAAAGVWIAVVARVHGVLVQVALAAGAFLWVLGRALWVTVPPPEGLRLDRIDAPRLFELVDEVATSLRAPRVHALHLTSDFNAGMLQAPRLGIFGWHRNILLVGLPLLESLTPVQWRAVLAHELGHLSGQHSRLSLWIYRVRQTWDRLLAQLEQRRSWFTGIFTGFFRWYAPHFSAASFVLVRADEFVADACAAQAAGTVAAREALGRIELVGRHADRAVWPALRDLVHREPRPVPGRFLQAARSLRGPLPAEAARADLDAALAAATDCHDTHPAFAERLAALAARQGVPNDTGADYLARLCRGPGAESAAQRFLGAGLEALSRQVDALWCATVALSWAERHRHASETGARIQELESRAPGSLSDEEAWTRVFGLADVRGAAAALPEIEAFVSAHPEHAPARFLFGRTLIEQRDARGLEHVQRAMELDSDAVGPGCELAAQFLRGQGRAAEADAFQKRAWEHDEAARAAHEERSTLGKRADLRPHGLDADAREALRAALFEVPELEAAYLMRREVKHRSDKPAFVLGLVPRRPWYRLADARREHAVAQRVAKLAALPEGTYLFLLVDTLGWVRKRAARIEGAAILTTAETGNRRPAPVGPVAERQAA